MTVYHYQTNSKAAPFFSDPNSGFIEAKSALEALKELVKQYKHPCGLFSAIIESCEPKPKMLARFLSASALAQEVAADKSKGGICGMGECYRIRTDDGDAYVYVKDYQDKVEAFK